MYVQAPVLRTDSRLRPKVETQGAAHFAAASSTYSSRIRTSREVRYACTLIVPPRRYDCNQCSSRHYPGGAPNREGCRRSPVTPWFCFSHSRSVLTLIEAYFPACSRCSATMNRFVLAQAISVLAAALQAYVSIVLTMGKSEAALLAFAELITHLPDFQGI